MKQNLIKRNGTEDNDIFDRILDKIDSGEYKITYDENGDIYEINKKEEK